MIDQSSSIKHQKPRITDNERRTTDKQQMITIFSPDHALHDAPHEFLDGRLITPHESPIRVQMILEAIDRAGIGPNQLPRAFDLDPIRAVHDDDYLVYLAQAYERWVAAGGAAAAVLPSTLAVRWM